MLEWCYQFLKFDQTGHVLLRQHAAALITFIGCGRTMSDVAPFADKLTICFSKWFHLAGAHGIVEASVTQIRTKRRFNNFNTFFLVIPKHAVGHMSGRLYALCQFI